MSEEIIVVRALTDSDMGLFRAHRKETASRQRAIALTTPAAERLLHPKVIAARGGEFDCICLFGGAMNREFRKIGKPDKNWRLGGQQLDHPDFRDLDSRDFALLRSVSHNDGTRPILITFVGRRAQRLLQAGLASTLETKLVHSVAVISSDADEFEALADLFPAIPPRAALRPALAQAAQP